jgi:glutamate carboxypeptidase
VLLIGHLDTVFEKQSPVQPWDRQGKRVRGQGVVDMKGGDVAIVEALRALHGLGLLDGTTITVYLGGDEERSGAPLAGSRRDLVEAAKASDVALGFEGIRRMRNGEDMAVVGRRGSSSIRLEVTAQPGHSSAVFSPGGAGLGAIYEGARVLNTIREQVAEPGLSFNPGVALGGTNAEFDIVQSSGTAFGKNNVISRQFVTHLDLRFVDPAQEQRAREKIREVAAESLRGTRSVVKFASGYPSMVATAGNQALLAAYSRASEDAGYGAVHASSTLEGGASDASHVSPFVDVIDGLGPWGGGAHGVNEWLDIPSVERATVRAAILIYRLTRAP